MRNLIKTIAKVIGVFVINAIAIILINFTISGLLAVLTQSYFFGIVSSNAMLVFSVLGYFVGVIMSVFHIEEKKNK
jgi:VanZ family protein